MSLGDSLVQIDVARKHLLSRRPGIGDLRHIGMVILGKSYAGAGIVDARRNSSSDLDFKGGNCAFCCLTMSAGDEQLVRLKKDGKVVDAAEEGCLAKALSGRYGEKQQFEAIAFLGKADLSDRHRVVHAALRAFRRGIRPTQAR